MAESVLIAPYVTFAFWPNADDHLAMPALSIGNSMPASRIRTLWGGNCRTLGWAMGSLQSDTDTQCAGQVNAVTQLKGKVTSCRQMVGYSVRLTCLRSNDEA